MRRLKARGSSEPRLECLLGPATLVPLPSPLIPSLSSLTPASALLHTLSSTLERVLPAAHATSLLAASFGSELGSPTRGTTGCPEGRMGTHRMAGKLDSCSLRSRIETDRAVFNPTSPQADLQVRPALISHPAALANVCGDTVSYPGRYTPQSLATFLGEQLFNVGSGRPPGP